MHPMSVDATANLISFVSRPSYRKAYKNSDTPRSAAEIGENIANRKIEMKTLFPCPLSCQIKKATNACMEKIKGYVLSTLNRAAGIQNPGIDTMKITASRANRLFAKVIRF